VTHAQRINELLGVLKQQGNASTKYLARVLDVSESTVRRDLDFLASMHEDVQRVHGGAVLRTAERDLEYMFELKQNVNTSLKRRLAAEVMTYVADSDRILLDSGTTCLQIASNLHRRSHLRVVTTDIKIADELAKYANIESIIIGGLIRPGYYTVGETLALSMLDRFSVDKTIMSADAVDLQHGVSNFSMFEVGVKQKAIEMASTAILVADHTKFGDSSFYRVADLDRFHIVITTRELDEKTVEQIRDAGIELVLA
jgi:DeoR/GlpR family transcriptional regulator of sugar metabolism